MGVAGGAGIPNIGDCAGGAGPTPCSEGVENMRVYSLGPSCTGAGGADGGGVGAERGGPAGELNSFVYSPPPDGAGGGAGAGGTPGLAPEKAVVAPPGSTDGGDPTGGIGEAFPGPDGVPNKRVNAPGSCCAGGDACGGVATGGRLRSSPPGPDSGMGDWKNRVNSPVFAGAGGGSAFTGDPAGDRNSLVNDPGSDDSAGGPGSGGWALATFAGGAA
jgi:hypothetical protein